MIKDMAIFIAAGCLFVVGVVFSILNVLDREPKQECFVPPPTATHVIFCKPQEVRGYRTACDVTHMYPIDRFMQNNTGEEQ